MYYCMWELNAYPCSNQVSYVQSALLTGKCSGLVGVTVGVQGYIAYVYPSGRFPTHPFRVLGLAALGNIKGEFISCKYHGRTV